MITIRQGDDSDFNGHSITFNLKTDKDLAGWQARFQLQDLLFTFDNIETKQVNLVITSEQSEQLETGTCFGYLQLIDNNGKKGTVYYVEFVVMPKRVEGV